MPQSLLIKPKICVFNMVYILIWFGFVVVTRGVFLFVVCFVCLFSLPGISSRVRISSRVTNQSQNKVVKVVYTRAKYDNDSILDVPSGSKA